MSTLTRKQREKQRHRRDVLLAAEKLFSWQGYHETAVQDIARKAEFAVGTLYNMFDNKADIYYELVRMRAKEYLDSVKEELGDMRDPSIKLRRVIRAKFDFFDSHRQFFTIFSRVLYEDPDDCSLSLTEEGRELYDEYMDLLTDIFRAGVESGQFVNLDPRLMTLSFEGATRMVISDRLLNSDSNVLNDEVDDMEQILFEGLLQEAADHNED